MYDFYKKCEESLKKQILLKYQDNLNQIQINNFNKKEYINDEVMGIKKLYDVFDYLLDKMLNDLLDVTTLQKRIIDEDTQISIPCGQTLKIALKNYYKLSISKILTFNPNINYKYAYDIDIIHNLNEEYDYIIDKNVFNKNVLELLEIKEISDFIEDTIYRDTQLFLDNN